MLPWPGQLGQNEWTNWIGPSIEAAREMIEQAQEIEAMKKLPKEKNKNKNREKQGGLNSKH